MIRSSRTFFLLIAAIITVAVAWADDAPKRKRHITPVSNAAAQTQAINETREDTARINAARRAASTSFLRDDGYTVYIDTVTGEEWVDSTSFKKQSEMKYPMLNGLNVGVNIWDPAMRLFGQKHGLIDFAAELDMYNRFFPTVEIGLGMANNNPAGETYTYKSPLSIYAKIGMNYNFLFNKNPDYKFFGGIRYGFSPFSWSVEGITVDSPFWNEIAHTSVPSQNATAGWLEIMAGLRVKLFSNISAGWMLRFHSILHESKSNYGEPWYIPGYGARGGVLTGSFSIFYTLPIKKKTPVAEIEAEVAAEQGPQ